MTCAAWRSVFSKAALSDSCQTLPSAHAHREQCELPPRVGRGTQASKNVVRPANPIPTVLAGCGSMPLLTLSQLAAASALKRDLAAVRDGTAGLRGMPRAGLNTRNGLRPGTEGHGSAMAKLKPIQAIGRTPAGHADRHGLVATLFQPRADQPSMGPASSRSGGCQTAEHVHATMRLDAWRHASTCCEDLLPDRTLALAGLCRGIGICARRLASPGGNHGASFTVTG